MPTFAPAQGQYEAAIEAMSAPELPGPLNRLAPPDWGRAPQLPPAKARVRALLTASAGQPPKPSAPAERPEARVPAAPGAPPPPGLPPGPGPLPPPGAVAAPGPGTPRPSTPGTTAQKPAPLAEPEQVRLKADSVYQTEGATAAQGNVEVRYQDLIVRSQAAELDKDRIWGTFRGDVDLEAPYYRGQAEQLRINLDTEHWLVKKGSVAVQPDFFETTSVLEPLFIRADEVLGRPDRVEGTNGIATSCDHWPGPHWMLRSDKVTMVPDDRVTFRRPTLYMFGHRIIRYPWDLTLSLRRQENRFLPEVGQNEVEGYYAKFAYGYLLNDANSGFIRLNLTQKRGTGFGFDHLLEDIRQTAQVSFFAEPDEDSYSGRLLHRLQLSRTFGSNLNLSFQEDSGYGIASDSLNGDLTFRYDGATTQSLLGFQESTISTGSTTSRRFSSNVSHQQRLGTTGQWAFTSSYHSSTVGTGLADDEELESEFSWRQQYRRFDVNLLAQKRYDIDGSRYTGDSNYYALNRTPDIAIRTDSSRLGNSRLLGSEFDATMYLGRFEQQPEDLTIYRTGVDLRMPGRERQFGRSRLRTSGRFRQLFYSDDSAQWVGEVHTEYRRELSGTWNSRVSFDYVRPNGYSPLRLDLVSPSSIAYLQLVRLVPDKMRVDLTFGRDLHNNYFHDAILRSEFMFSPRNRLELQGGYSVEAAQWRPINMRWIYATPRRWWSALTVNYDLDDSELTNVSMDIDYEPTDKWRVQFLGGYSSFGGFDQADFRITRDLHCMLASLTYIQSTGEIRLGLGIKAFPSATRTFGIGQRGQYFESNFGDQY